MVLVTDVDVDVAVHVHVMANVNVDVAFHARLLRPVFGVADAPAVALDKPGRPDPSGGLALARLGPSNGLA